MKQQLKKVIIIICACVAILAGVLFGMYKIFVTPKVIVGLALNNAKEGITKSTEFFIDSDEKELIQRIRKNGGKTEMNITVSESSFLEGASAEITSNSDGTCAVTEIKFNDYLTLETYKDAERILINTPLFSGGFEVKLDDIEEAIVNSIFKDKIVSSPSAMASSAVLAFMAGDAEVDFDMLKSIASGTDIKKSGKATVIIGSETKKADEYTAHIASEDMDRIINILKAYGKELGIEEADMENSLQSIRTDCDIAFKIKNFELYEICITTAESEKTIAFTGDKNQFDTIVYYENDDTKNAVRRYHDQRGNNITEEITVGEKTVLSIDKNIDKTEVRVGSGEYPFVISVSGKNVGDHSLSYQNLEFGLEDRFMITSDLYVSEDYDADFAFDKSGEYIDLFSITQDAWSAVSGVLTQGIKIFQ